MAKPKRVLQIVRKMDIGGVQSMIMNYYRHIDKEKVQFDFIVQGEEEGFFDKEILSMGGVIYRVKPMKKLLSYLRDVNKVLKENKFEIIHVHHNYANIYSLLLSYKHGIPMRISHSHNSYPESSLLKKLIKSNTQILINAFSTHKFACSALAGEWLYGESQKKNIIIINNAIDTEKYRFSDLTRQQKRQELNVKDKIIVGHIGNFTEQKNHEFLINIFSEIHKRNNNTHLVLVGDGYLKENIIQKVDSMNLSENVTFLGKRHDVNELLSAFDVFLFPSLYEGLPVVIVEAQVANLRCILSDDISKEIVISNLVNFLELDQPLSKWADLVLMNIEQNTRREMSEHVMSNGYDIKHESEKLQSIYINTSIS